MRPRRRAFYEWVKTLAAPRRARAFVFTAAYRPFTMGTTSDEGAGERYIIRDDRSYARRVIADELYSINPRRREQSS